MRLTFIGAARTVTGSLYLLESGGKKLTMECGLFQGHREEAERINRTFPFKPKEITAAVISHGHLDHAGNLPSLVGRGFAGRIYATAATRDVATLLLLDAANIQENDIAFLNRRLEKKGLPTKTPLYTVAEAEATAARFSAVGYEQEFEPVPGVRVTLYDAGHILGSAQILIETGGKRILFSGDLGRKGMPIIRDPARVGDIDDLILESTYGNRTHTPMAGMTGELSALIAEGRRRQSKMIIPAFAVERTQLLIKILKELHDRGELKDIPVYVDSPLAGDVTNVYREHPECFDEEMYKIFLKDDPFSFPGLKYIRASEESKRLNSRKQTMIIVAGSGMAEGGRVLHHLVHSAGDPDNMIIFVGFQARGTLGRKIIEGARRMSIFGEEYELNAQVHFLGGFSAHADQGELLDYVERLARPRLKEIYLVHGELEQASALAAQITGLNLGVEVTIPESQTEIEI